jgi:hypothetical protein
VRQRRGGIARQWRGACAAVAISWAAASGAAAQSVLYVDGAAPAGGDGLSWATAFRHLQSALSAAGTNPAIGEIRVAQGEYKPDETPANPQGSGDVFATFALVDDVALMGGFAGLSGPDPDECDPARYQSVLSGDLLGNDDGMGGNINDNSRHVVTVDVPCGATVVLDGLVVTRGAAVGSGVEKSAGGLLAMASCQQALAELVLRDCVFIANEAKDNGNAVWINGPDQAWIVRCSFVGNGLEATETTTGGALLVDDNGATTIVSCLFASNRGGEGGAIYSSGSTTVINSTIVGNAAGVGGGLRTAGGDVLLSSIVFSNSAPIGPAISCSQCAGVAVSSSCIQGGWPGPGNISANPMFAGADRGDYRLLPGSPCIDSGDSTAVPAGVASDLDGSFRFQDDPAAPDVGVPDGVHSIVDMGAYEAPGLPTVFGDCAWIEPAGGSFSDFANWFPGPPGIGNPAIIDLGASFTVTLDVDAEIARLIVDSPSGEVSLLLGGHTLHLLDLAQPSLTVGESESALTSLVVQDGSLVVEDAVIGRFLDAGGTLTLRGGGVTTCQVEGQLFVGAAGAGSLVLVKDAQAPTGPAMISPIAFVGFGPESSGTVLVGEGAEWLLQLFLIIDNGLVTVEEGGALSAGFLGILVTENGSLGGEGQIIGDVVSVGDVWPGIGVLEVSGDYAQVGQDPQFGPASGSLLVELGDGCAAGGLSVGGEASLGGGLFVALAGACTPALDDSFAILAAAARSGAFDVAFLPGLEGGDRYLRVGYGAGAAAGTEVVSIDVASLPSGIAFGAPAGTIVPGVPSDAVAGDLDGDGTLDLALTIPAGAGQPGALVILLGDGRGGFASGQSITVGAGPSAAALGYFDADLTLDLAVAHAEDDDVTVLLNLGGGVFPPDNPAAHVPVGAAPADIAAGNLHDASGNQPGAFDLVVANAGDGTVSILANDGLGAFAPQSGPLLAGTQPIASNPLDVDNDKDLDLAVIDFASGTLLLHARQDGLFDAPVVIPVGGQPRAFAPGDPLMDGDGFDLDQNGFFDLVTANAGGSVSVVLNQGGLQFAPAVNLPLGAAGVSITALDVEHDGDTDLAVVTAGAERGAALIALRNDLNPQQGGEQLAFVAPQDLGADPGTILVLGGDVDGDGDQDLIALTAGGAGPGPGAAEPAVEVVPNLLRGTTPVPGDANGDGAVNVADLVAVVLAWGPCPKPCPPSCAADVTADCSVEVADLVAVVLNWG